MYSSPIASITAAVVAEALKKPLRITEETYQKNEGIVDRYPRAELVVLHNSSFACPESWRS